MRFSIVAAVAAFSSTALAQGLLDQIPTCAQSCFGSNLGTCGIADIACICSSNAIDAVSCCVFDTCSQEDIAATTQFAVQLCNLQNVDVNTAPSCPSGSATPSAGSSSATPTGSASATPSGSASPTSGSASATSGSASATSGSASPSADDASATSSASAAGSTGAAPLQTAGAGVGLGLAMVGLLAAL